MVEGEISKPQIPSCHFGTKPKFVCIKSNVNNKYS